MSLSNTLPDDMLRVVMSFLQLSAAAALSAASHGTLAAFDDKTKARIAASELRAEKGGKTAAQQEKNTAQQATLVATQEALAATQKTITALQETKVAKEQTIAANEQRIAAIQEIFSLEEVVAALHLRLE